MENRMLKGVGLWRDYYECKYCGFHFISPEELETHLQYCCEAQKVDEVMYRMTGHYILNKEED